MLRILACFCVVVLGCVLLLISLTGCTRRDERTTLRIGIITAATGSQAAFGEAHKNGYQIALDEINASGGVLGRKVDLDFYDDTSKPNQAVLGVSKLVDQDGMTILIGSYSSESTKAIIPVVTQKQIPLIIPTATADNVMESHSPWIFRICAGSETLATSTLAFLKNNGDPKTMAIVYENTNFGQTNEEAMLDAAKKEGINVVANEAYQASSPDYRALLQKVKQFNPEVVYFASYLLDATTLMRQAQEVGLNPKFFTSAGTGFAAAEFPTSDKGAGKNAEYTFSVSQWLPAAGWKGAVRFDEEYFRRHNSHPAYHAMQAYAALMTAAAAINIAGSGEPSAVRDALKQVNLPDTPFGPIKFDANGQNSHPVLITQVQNKTYKVVWPVGVADAKPIIPTPPWDQR